VVGKDTVLAFKIHINNKVSLPLWHMKNMEVMYILNLIIRHSISVEEMPLTKFRLSTNCTNKCTVIN
jgi:hypothetical protein